MAGRRYDESVFINCPFDSEYRRLFQALVFAVQDCGCFPRCSLEIADSSAVRIESIMRIIRECRYGIHDISRVELGANGLPRFNMPLELGLFLGAKRFGGSKQRRKGCLVLDKEKYRYQQFCSDIAGQDVADHGLDPNILIRRVRNWLRTARPRVELPGAKTIARRFDRFTAALPVICATNQLDIDDLTFIDLRNIVAQYLEQIT